MDLRQVALAVCSATAVYVWYKRYYTLPISDVPGPKNPSWIYGHRWWWQCEEAGVFERKMMEEHGTVARWNGSLGEERLWIADPKAIHHILQVRSHMYDKPAFLKGVIATVMDRGLSWAAGDAHKRQRRAMAPAFGLVEAKALYPYFARSSNSLADKWHETISSVEFGQAAIINVHYWLSKGTLDAIGAGAFDYDFGAVENTNNKFTKSYTNILFNAFAKPSKERLFVFDLMEWTPRAFANWVLERDQSPGMKGLRENRAYAHEVAVKLIKEKRQELKDGTSRKDLLSLLVKANSALRPEWRLNDEEIIAQVRTIVFAGHDTTSGVLTLALWEFAKNRQIQERLRTEIMETLRKIRTRGDSDFTVNDFDAMPYLLAVGKEILRVHPALIEIPRVSKEVDVLPLSKPLVGVSGKVYKELPIPAGTATMISTLGYNLNKDLWGPDAHEFRPERWLDVDGKPESPFGVFSNLATFSGGARSCIGWRFAVIEMHAFLVTLVRQFDFFLPENGQEVKKMRPGMMMPLVVGEEHKGPQMPLKVAILGGK